MYISIFIKYFHLFFTTHSFSGPFHICLPRNTHRLKDCWRISYKRILQVHLSTCGVLENLFQTRTVSVVFNLPRNCSPAHFLALLCVLWIYTFLHNFSHASRDPQTPGKKITAFYTASYETCFYPRCIRGHGPRKASHSLCTLSAWSFAAGNRQQQHDPASWSSPHTKLTGQQWQCMRGSTRQLGCKAAPQTQAIHTR